MLLGVSSVIADTEAPPARTAGDPAFPFVFPARLPPGSENPRTYRWEEVKGESLALIGPFGVIWRFNFGATQAKPHFHPLQTATGQLVSWNNPPDHVWHHGLWHSWKMINGVNYWEENGPNGVAEGTTRISKVEVLRQNDLGAAFRLQLDYFPAATPSQTVLHDTVDVVVGMPAADGSYVIEWSQTTSAVGGPVVLAATPHGTEPDAKPWGGYGGFSLRGSRYLRSVDYVSSEGRRGVDCHRQAADWVSLIGESDGAFVGVTFFAAPQNAVHPTKWFVLSAEKEPFWYLNAAVLHDVPLTVVPEKPLTFRFAVRIDSQRQTEGRLAEFFRTFALQSYVP